MNAIVKPEHVYALVQGPAKDVVLFYHQDATVRDLNAVWEHVRFCCSNLVWVNDHFIVTPNPLYLRPVADLTERFAPVVTALLQWYSAKRSVAGVMNIDMLGQPLEEETVL
jgi:hypothetical protein